MGLYKYFLFAVISLALFSCNNSSITGKWKQVQADRYAGDEIILAINKDSTFTINHGKNKGGATIPGGRAGDKISGTWRLPDANTLQLTMPVDGEQFPVVYKIETLNNTKLVLRFSEEEPTVYIRL